MTSSHKGVRPDQKVEAETPMNEWYQYNTDDTCSCNPSDADSDFLRLSGEHSDPHCGLDEWTRDLLEAVVVDLIVWNPRVDVAAAHIDGLLDPELFWHRRPVIEAVIRLVEDGGTVDPVSIRGQMAEDGQRDRTIKSLLFESEASTAINGRIMSLDVLLAMMRQRRERDKARELLAGLADALDRPGGLQRVQRVLQGVAS